MKSELKQGLANKYWVLIPAAGIGKRMGGETPKQYLSLAGRTILEWTLSRIEQLDNIEKIILILQPDDPFWPSNKLPHSEKMITAEGGNERFHSVMNGLAAIKGRVDDNDWILVHDVVRPCVSLTDINKLISTLANDPVGGLLASRVKDTLKQASADNEVIYTLNREDCWLAATPQMFRYGLLCEAMQNALNNELKITDEASAMEAMGHAVKLIEGRSDNIKVTRPEDLPLVEFLLQQESRDAI